MWVVLKLRPWLTLMKSTFSRSEPCWWEELIRWRGWFLPPEEDEGMSAAVDGHVQPGDG